MDPLGIGKKGRFLVVLLEVQYTHIITKRINGVYYLREVGEDMDRR